MGWHNPPVNWAELERALSGRDSGAPATGDGGDAPAWARHRERYQAPAAGISTPDAAERVPYAELHCHSNFSFLDGASHPAELVETAAALGLDAIALTDHDGMYGVVRFAEAARELGVRTIFGTELSLGLSAPQNGIADPEGEHLLLLAAGPEGYTRLCRAITQGHLDADVAGGVRADAAKGRPVYCLDRVLEETREHCVVLTGCRKGSVRRALALDGPAGGMRELRLLVDRFGSDRVFVELTDHGCPEDSTRNDLLFAMAAELKLPTVASTAAHYAEASRSRLAAALAAIRARRGLDEMAGWLPPAGGAHLRSGADMARRFARYPGVVRQAAELGRSLQFDLQQVAPKLPPFDVGPNHTEISFLRKLTYEHAVDRYGSPADSPQAYRQLEHELAVIEQLEFPGYFLIVWDIVRFCRDHGIYCQGRGSAANSAVCYALGITGVDAVANGLLFERFLAPARDGPPDIDLDIESDRREEAIQYVYTKYDRWHAAQVANVISYRSRFAVRDAARALGFSPGQQDAWSKQIDGWSPIGPTQASAATGEVTQASAGTGEVTQASAGTGEVTQASAATGEVTQASGDPDAIPAAVLGLAAQLQGFPRHLGIHSGGMVICDRPVSEVCPVERARMADRTVLQWDKEDCAAAGLVKFDLLGLGMLSAVHYMVDLVAERCGVAVDIAKLTLDDPEVYAMLARADAVGVFQVESRAQMATLPRLQPTRFYDLVVEVALIRPGPIQGGSVHPYIRRYNGLEEWEHEHPLLAGALDKTLGVPLFQEQMMQIAIDVADFTPAESDELRRAMGSNRSAARMQRLHDRFLAGAEANGVDADVATRIFAKLKAFANFGFPESHAFSFAYLVYVSAWFKRYHPAAFCAGLLRAQPMGFYSPQSLVADARRHGVVVRGPDLNAGNTHADLEESAGASGSPAIRIGLATVRTIGVELAETIVAERTRSGPFTDLADLSRRVPLTRPQLEALATAGAFGCFDSHRRQALWAAGAAAGERHDRLPGTTVVAAAPMLPGMDAVESAVADVWAMGLSPDSFPIQFARARLDALGAISAAALAEVIGGTRVLVGGAVTHRQRPATAGGITFLNLEDETGMINIVCTSGLWARYRRVARTSQALIVRGIVENVDGSVSLLADRLDRLELRIPSSSRDFR